MRSAGDNAEMGRLTGRDAGGDPVDPGSMGEDDLSPVETAREKRRDRDAEAQTRAGMRTGLAKQFKQVLDVQRARADEVERRQGKSAGEPEAHGARPWKSRKT